MKTSEIRAVPTPNPIYRILAWAIENRVPLSCDYKGQRREIRPIVLGQKNTGEDVLLAYQVGGASSGEPIRGPDWRCLYLSKLSHVEIADGEWQAGASHSKRQTCVDDVDYDVNEVSPYAPRHSLGELRGDPAPEVGEGA